MKKRTPNYFIIEFFEENRPTKPPYKTKYINFDNISEIDVYKNPYQVTIHYKNSIYYDLSYYNSDLTQMGSKDKCREFVKCITKKIEKAFHEYIGMEEK